MLKTLTIIFDKILSLIKDQNLKIMFRVFLLGSVILIIPVLFLSCVYDDINKSDCETSDLAISKSVINATTCSASDGSIAVSATGGAAPFTFSKNGIDFSSSAEFNNLVSGTYILTVKDSKNCERTVEAIVGGSGFTAGVTIDVGSGCNTSNGEITIVASGGTEPYTYKLGNGNFVSGNTFTSLAKGIYDVTVKDASTINCLYFVSEIKVTTGISYMDDIKPILEANCIKSGCHNGDNGAERDWSKFANVKAKASGIKTRTGNKSMPQDIAPTGLPQNEIDLIACWVDDGALEN